MNANIGKRKGFGMRIWRAWLLWAAVGGLLAALPGQLSPELRLLAGTLRPEAALDPVALARGLAAGLLLGCVLWWWAAATAVLVAATRGRRLRPRGCPRWVHRMVLGALGAAVAGGLATPALAADGADAAATSAEAVRGLPYPDRAEGEPVLADTAPPAGHHVVRPGDTLWALAARDLSPAASAAEVTDRWQLIYRLNRAAIGPDPDLIVPGTSLELPTPREETR
jgi:nucleoid-associated protein YgaU